MFTKRTELAAYYLNVVHYLKFPIESIAKGVACNFASQQIYFVPLDRFIWEHIFEIYLRCRFIFYI